MAAGSATLQSSHRIPVQRRGRRKPHKCKQSQARRGNNVQGQKKKRARTIEDDVYVSKEAREFMKERAEELQARLDPKFPSFVKIMMPSHVSGCFWLGLPSAFCSDYLPQENTTMKLVDEDSTTFNSSYMPCNTGLSGGWLGPANTGLRVGWLEFSRAKGLVHGDAVVFQLVDSTTFKVYVLRANDVAAAAAASAHLQNQDACNGGSENWENISLVQVKNETRSFQKESGPSRLALCISANTEQELPCDAAEDSEALVSPLDDSSSSCQLKQKSKQLPPIGAAPVALVPSVNGGANCKEVVTHKDDKQKGTASEKLDVGQSKPKRMVRVGLSDYVLELQHKDATGTASREPPPLKQSSSSSRSEETEPRQKKQPLKIAAHPLPFANANQDAIPALSRAQELEKIPARSSQLREIQKQSCSLTASATCSWCAHLKSAISHEAEEVEAAAEENTRLRFRKACKACLDGDASVLLLPCRHLCLCRGCEAGIRCCPVCGSAKVSCVQVFLS